MVQLLQRAGCWFLGAHKEFPDDPALHSRVYFQRDGSSVLKRCLYISAHRSIIHNNQKTEVIQVSADGSMDKGNVVHPYSGVFFTLRKA